MKRREFIHTAILPSLFPMMAFADSQEYSKSPAKSCYFYDERFATAKLLSREWRPEGEIFSVQGDITSLWNNELKLANQNSLLNLEGVTTESFYFCLQRMLQMSSPQTKISSSSKRLEQNLFYWSIVTNKNNNRRKS